VAGISQGERMVTALQLHWLPQGRLNVTATRGAPMADGSKGQMATSAFAVLTGRDEYADKAGPSRPAPPIRARPQSYRREGSAATSAATCPSRRQLLATWR
jgi:hypothetical protein